jgi:hypothetical protein
MITISEEIKRIILSSPFLEEALFEGLINLSALARKIKPEIEKNLFKSISESAILMSIKRFLPCLPKPIIKNSNISQNAGDLSVRSNLVEFTFAKSDSIYASQKELLHRIKDRRDCFITFTQGIYEVTVIANSHLANDLNSVFKNEKTISSLEDLSAISIRLSPLTVHQPGVHYSILKLLAWHNINVIEVVSTFTEFTIILKRENVDLSFSILLKSLSN